KPTLLLIDGHSLAFRAFYALSPDSFKTPDGQHTNAVHGFISMMLNIIANEKPTHLAVAFDLSRVSFRTEQYPEYKGTRGETPPEFNGQTELLTEALAAMNITTLTRENYEADDIIASLADQGTAQGFEVLIVSGDRDTFQLIQEEVTILYPVKGVMNLARMNDAAVVEKYGIHAKQYPDLAALVGETSDNLPGIPGVGPKTAAKWLQQYGDLASILKAAEEISGKVGESLREHRELAVRNRKLNHLVRDLDIGMPFESFAMKPVEEDNLRATFAKLHFRSLLERVFKGLGVIRSDKANVEAITLVSQAETTGAAQTQLELPNATELSEKALEKLFSSKTVVAVFPVFDEGDLIGVGLATDKERLYLDYKSNKKELGKFFESDVTKNIFDSKRIQRWLLNQKIHLESVIDDPMLMAYVENPLRRNFGAEELISEFLGLSISSTQEIGEDGLDLSAIAWYLNPLCKKINETLVQSKQDFIYKSVELPSARALAKMEQVGVSINTADLTKLIKQLDKEISQLA
ncbi:MAG: DNA polymerase I, partial [Micrococcales bacterium]|nr:DNA polymerase I [Micrococcales bacterium]